MCVWFTRWWDLPDCVLLFLGILNTLQIRNPIKGSEIKSRSHFLFSRNLPFQTAINSVTLIYLPLGNHCLEEATGKVGVECEMAISHLKLISLEWDILPIEDSWTLWKSVQFGTLQKEPQEPIKTYHSWLTSKQKCFGHVLPNYWPETKCLASISQFYLSQKKSIPYYRGPHF